MPIPEPGNYDDQDSFIEACMSAQADEDLAQDQKLAICFSMWRDRSLPPMGEVIRGPWQEAPSSPIERRAVQASLRLDQKAGDYAPVIRGYAIVFNSLSEQLGGGYLPVFRERIRPTAIERTLREELDVRALVDHDAAKILGRTRAKTLQLEVDDHGVRVRIDPPNTTAGRDIVESIRRGDISGMSFAFRTMKDSWHQEGGGDIREIHDMAIHDVSVVTFPAYPETDVQVAQRSYLAAHRRPPEPSRWVPGLVHQHRQRLYDQERRRRG